MNAIIQDLIIEIEPIKKTQNEGMLEKENIGKRTGTPGTNIRGVLW